MQIVTKLGHTKENMTLEDQIKEVLFLMSQELKIHKLDNDNMILEVNYDKYVNMLKSILEGYRSTQETK